MTDGVEQFSLSRRQKTFHFFESEGFFGSFRFPDCEDDLFNFSWKAELCKGLPNTMTAKSWSFGDSGRGFDGLYGKESIFKPIWSWRRWCTKWESIVGNQYRIVQLGIIIILIVLPLMSFDMDARLHGGNVYILQGFKLRLKAFTAMLYGPYI